MTDIRDQPAPRDVLVGGSAATLLDATDTIADRLPWALAVIALSTFLLLFLFTGSVLIPLKAIVTNLLSLSATFGALVYVFQEGHLRWLVVVSGDVGQPGDRWPASDGGVGAVVIVEVEPPG
ncbi:MMPL family transporter [Nocardioides sp. SOB77]|uniref:MMPL family transporter n=1 Tax=Nocardioides oceani TaxID=3058369 RepID=A0ABT8FKY5_9ACTN|nr:MMPL family transporter [Nocardioides oceani]MDN4175181.1 MMPL family transporter [Nocardioides oceani]